MIEKKSYLVQRIKRKKKDNTKKGVDQLFQFDYMGASEFEWGALPEALKAMKDQENVGMPITTQDGDRTVTAYFHGPEGVLPIAQHLFETHYHGNRRDCYTKERTQIQDAYSPRNEWDKELIGWWDIEHHFVIFKSKQDRKLWRRTTK